MKITIKLYGVLRSDRFKEELCDYPPGSTVQEVLSDLALPEKLLGTVLVNGVHSDKERPLQEGDILTFLPILCGG